MEQNNTKEIDLVALAKTVWAKRKKIILWGVIGLFAGIVISISIPNEYTSQLKVAPEGGGKENYGASGIAAMMGVNLSGSSNEGVTEKMYPEIIISTPFLMEFVDLEVDYKGQTIPLSDYILKHQSRPWWSHVMSFPGQTIGWVKSLGQDKVNTMTIKNSPAIQYAFVGGISSKIKLENDAKKGTIQIKSTFQDPKIAKMVLDTLVVKLQEYMTNYRTARTQTNLASNIKMLEEAKAKYYDADEFYAQAQDRNQNTMSKSATIKLDRLKNERDLTYQIYHQLAMQVETDKVKLQEEKSILTVIEPVTAPLQPSAPRKILIIVAFAFLGAFGVAVSVLIKILLTDKN